MPYTEHILQYFSLNVLNCAVKLRYKTLQNMSLAHNVHFHAVSTTKSIHTVPITIVPEGMETKPSPKSSTITI
jgi:hypothetical protein